MTVVLVIPKTAKQCEQNFESMIGFVTPRWLIGHLAAEYSPPVSSCSLTLTYFTVCFNAGRNNKWQPLLNCLILILCRLLRGHEIGPFPTKYEEKNVSNVVGYADITAAECRTAVRTRQPLAFVTHEQQMKCFLEPLCTKQCTFSKLIELL